MTRTKHQQHASVSSDRAAFSYVGSWHRTISTGTTVLGKRSDLAALQKGGGAPPRLFRVEGGLGSPLLPVPLILYRTVR